MKKTILTILLTLALALSCAALAEAPEDAYVGDWVYEEMSLYLFKDEDGKLSATIYAPEDPDHYTAWSYEDISYDEVADELNTVETGVKQVLTYTEEGVYAELIYDDGAAAFRLTDDDTLQWVDYKEGADTFVTFERAEEILMAPDAEAFQDEYFRPIGQVEKGSAGSDLKLAQAAGEAAAFAVRYEMYAPDVDALRANMLEAWEGLKEEERSAFDANFMDVVELMDACLEDWEANRPLFEDAGVADELAAVMYDPLTRLAWETLRDHTLTMGNSDGE